MSNIDEFAEVAVVILDRLYSTFPRRISLGNTSFGEGLPEETLALYRDTLLFLAHEGVIRYESWSNGQVIYFNGVTLTAKGFDLLLPKPTAPEPKEETMSRGERVSEVLKTGSTELMKVVVRELINQMATHMH